MKIQYNALQEYLKSVLPLLDHSVSVALQYRGRPKEGHKNIVLKGETDYPVYINHTNRLKTLVKQCKDMDELKAETDKYIKKYPAQHTHARPIQTRLDKTSIYMQQYNKKPEAPVTTKAVKYDGDYDNLRNAAQTAGSVDAFDYKEHDHSITINAEGVILMPGQYLLADANGNFSISDAESFEAGWDLAPAS